jgi:hypothetical protein
MAAAASVYAPAARAGVYVGVGVPSRVVVAPVVAPRLVAGVPAPYYYAPPVWFGAGYFGPHFWSYGHVYGRPYYGHGTYGHGTYGHGWSHAHR